MKLEKASMIKVGVNLQFIKKLNNMTPQQIKAKKLMKKFYYAKSGDGYHSLSLTRAKNGAIIAVEEIIDALNISLIDADIEWWKQVKEEIEKL